ncbi:conserved hypothetical protein [Methanohalobium evestigatum Z-7303]|uniref:Uncharacterized protein n=2 Tax=Methanohalobium evestigatum TaxID=2322 RepID=D7E703_METEZ|nr:conserved hypothetical protein [Methanohalobium evestigatum Z-7303]
MNSEIILNILICLAITVSSFTLAWVLGKNKLKQNNKPSLWSLISLWFLIGVTYLTISIGIFAEYLQHQYLNTAMLNLGSVSFAFVSVPLVFFITYVIIGDKNISSIISSVFAIFSILYLNYFHSINAGNLGATDHSSIISVSGDLTIYMYIIALFIIPTSMILGLLLLLLLQKLPRSTHYKKTLPLVGMSLVFDFMMLDVLTLTETMQLSARIFIVVGIVLTFLAYFPPDSYQKKIRVNDYS